MGEIRGNVLVIQKETFSRFVLIRSPVLSRKPGMIFKTSQNMFEKQIVEKKG